jgi:AcrR family transcriptional regulator
MRIGCFRIRRSVVSEYATNMLGSARLLLMAEKDIGKVTIDELAARAGMDRATYFRNFSS